MTVAYRTAELRDMPAAAELFVETMVDLCRRNGVPVTQPDPAGIVPWYAHIRETGVFEVGEDDGALVSFACGIVRDEHFFLSMFWTKPSRQQQGHGKPLLARVWSEAAQRGARTHSVWSSIDYAAIGTYLGLGMRPVGPILSLGGAPRAVAIEAELAPLDVATAGAIDREVRGTARAMDHAFFLREKRTAHAVREGERVLGYFYAHEGRVGPVAWAADVDGERVLGAAIETARSDATTVSLSIPGPNRVAIDLAVAHGLKIQGTSHLLASEPVGAIERYVPSGPALF